MKRQIIRLTEDDLHQIIENSVLKCLNEIGDTPKGQYMLGRLDGAHKFLKKDDTDSIRDYASDKFIKNKHNFPNHNDMNASFKNDETINNIFPPSENEREVSSEFYDGKDDFYDDIGLGSDSYDYRNNDIDYQDKLL